jgi:predicted kinase
MGVAGSGKTTLAQRLVRRLCAVYLDNNHIVDAFFPDRRSGRPYERLRPRFYRALYAITEANLVAGNSVVLDAPHVRQMQQGIWRAYIKRLVEKTNSRLVVIRCICPEATLRSRLASRGEKRDAAKMHRWRSFLAEQPIRVDVPFRHLDVDTSRSLVANTGAAVRYILSRSVSSR